MTVKDSEIPHYDKRHNVTDKAWGAVPIGLMDNNGHQNYKNRDTMMSYHPRMDCALVKANNGVYDLNDEFYKTCGGIFDPMPYYEEMFKK